MYIKKKVNSCQKLHLIILYPRIYSMTSKQIKYLNVTIFFQYSGAWLLPI
jgi:hypothetical protein